MLKDLFIHVYSEIHDYAQMFAAYFYLDSLIKVKFHISTIWPMCTVDLQAKCLKVIGRSRECGLHSAKLDLY